MVLETHPAAYPNCENDLAQPVFGLEAASFTLRQWMAQVVCLARLAKAAEAAGVTAHEAT